MTDRSIASVALGAMLLAGAPAFAQAKVYECKVASTMIDGKPGQPYTDEMRAKPEFRERFAIDSAAGKACRIMGDICSPFFTVLTLETTDSQLKASGSRVVDGARVAINYFPAQKRAFFYTGPVMTQTRSNDCEEISLTVMLP